MSYRCVTQELSKSVNGSLEKYNWKWEKEPEGEKVIENEKHRGKIMSERQRVKKRVT